MSKLQASSPLISLMGIFPLVPPQPPRFPPSPGSSSARSSSQPGLFSSLVGSPEVMFDDLLRDPEKYESGVSELLQQLILKQKQISSLSPEEMDLLDRATLDLNRSSSPKPVESSKPSVETVKTASATPSNEEIAEEKMPDDLIPSEGLDPHWFL